MIMRGGMTQGDQAAPATTPLQAYPEWPHGLGDPHIHLIDDPGARKSSTKSRKEIVAAFRAQQQPSTAANAPHKKVRERDFEDAKFPERKCSFQIQCHRGIATKKCHNCAKFDEQKLGFYCDACFDARHPGYRLDHSWVFIQDDVNQQHEWASHIVRLKLEQDAQELKLLLTETQDFLQQPQISSKVSPPTPPATPAPKPPSTAAGKRKVSVAAAPPPHPLPSKPKQPLAPRMLPRTASGGIDFHSTYVAVATIQDTLKELIAQIHAELERKPSLTKEEALLKIQRMWKLRSARKQLKALVRSVYASFEDPATGETYYYNSKTKTTQWTKPRLLDKSDELLVSSSVAKKATLSVKSHPEPKRVFGSREEQEEDAALRIQGMLRAHSARVHMRRLISSVYEKIWDASSARFYYHNTKTKQVKWEKPRWVNDADLLTPRARQRRQDEELKQRKVDALRSEMSPERAATMLQRAYRRKKGFENLLKLCQQVYERIFDPSQNAFYYHNTRTKETSWEKPAILRSVNADVFTPRTRQKQLERSAMVIAAASPLGSRSAGTETQRAIEPRVQRQWTEQQAAACLQGLYRTRQAKRQLDARLARVYRRVWDGDSSRFYYVNLQTQAVSWEPPALLLKSSIEVDEFQ